MKYILHFIQLLYFIIIIFFNVPSKIIFSNETFIATITFVDRSVWIVNYHVAFQIFIIVTSIAAVVTFIVYEQCVHD